MAAYDYTQPADASIEPIANNFRTYGDSVRALLWTARYAVAGPNTITVQFPDLLQAASTTTSNYVLSGPSAPSISSVAFTANTRTIVLNLSGPLSAVNTYTLAIKPDTVRSYYNTNWMNLVVDVILPTTIACVGVGVDQIIALGTPNINTTDAFIPPGFEQPIDLGAPVASSLVRPDGLGFEQTITLGTPISLAGATGVGVGIDQIIDRGTPLVAQQPQPLGVGIDQIIDLGAPVAALNPISLAGDGIQQEIVFGSPFIIGPGIVVGLGIDQFIDLGMPRATKDNTQDLGGIGIEQLIELGMPGPASPDTIRMIGIEQFILPGTPAVATDLGVTLRQKNALIDLDDALHKAFSEGVAQAALPNAIEPMNGYITQMSVLQQTQTRLPFKLAAAAELFSFNIPGAFPNTNDTDVTSIAKINNVGSEGSLIFVDGRLVIKVDPT